MFQGSLYSRQSCTTARGQLLLVHVHVSFPPAGRPSQAALRAAHTLPLTGVPYSVGSAAGIGVKGDFSNNWMKRCGEVVQISEVSQLQLIIVMVISEQEIEKAGL